MSIVLPLLVALVALAALVRWLEPRLAFFPFAGESETPRDFGVPFEATTVETRDGERLRAWIMRAPDARARVVYFHGNGGNLSNWAPILASIVRRGYSVFAFDYRGYGVSSGRPTERGLYRDVEAVVARAWSDDRDGGAPLIYWGRSLGCSMAGYAATVRAPAGVIVEAGFADARAAVRGSPLALLAILASYRFPAGEFLNHAKAPVLQLHGDRDSVIPFQRGRELHERLTVPKRFVTIAGGDHNDAAPADAAAYWSAIDAFAASLRR